MRPEQVRGGGGGRPRPRTCSADGPEGPAAPSAPPSPGAGFAPRAFCQIRTFSGCGVSSWLLCSTLCSLYRGSGDRGANLDEEEAKRMGGPEVRLRTAAGQRVSDAPCFSI